MTQPLRIGLLMHSLRPRGGVVHTLELATALAARGHAVTVLASAEPGETLFRTVGVPVEVVRLGPLQGGLVAQVAQRIESLVLGLPPLLRPGRFDLLHAQDSLSGNALALLQRQLADLPPWLRTVHHLDVFDDETLDRWQARSWRAAAGVACISDVWRDHFRERHSRRVERLFNGVDLGRHHPRPEPGDAACLAALGLPAQSGPVCLLVGGVEARKNTVRLLKAFARLRHGDAAWADARLVVAGGASLLDHGAALRGWRAALVETRLQEGAGRTVLRTGPLPDAALPALMRRATVLAMPSLMEGFGLAALEALACGTPVLVSRRAPFTEHLGDAPGVAWCDPEDTASIADGLARAAALPRLQVPPAVCLQHSWSRSAAGHEAWYRRTLAELRCLPQPALATTC